MERWHGRVALVTGASVGIGAALARELARRGMKVVACARNVQQLQAVADSVTGAVGEPGAGAGEAGETIQAGQVFPVQCDLRKEEQILAMFAEVKSRYGRLDVCINNAGLSHPAKLLGGMASAWREMWDVNVLALAICTREAVKLMDESDVKDGHIIHISSMAGHMVTAPDINFYTMTKHAVKAHTEGVRKELRERDSDIHISSVSPGNVDTEFADRHYARAPSSWREKYASHDSKWLESADIVDACIYALSCPSHTQVHDIIIRPHDQAN